MKKTCNYFNTPAFAFLQKKMHWVRYAPHEDGTQIFERATEFSITNVGEYIPDLKVSTCPIPLKLVFSCMVLPACINPINKKA